MAVEKIQSVFGKYASKMQVMIDKSKELYAPTWFGKYFDFGTPSMSLDFTTVIGRSRIESAASVVDRESQAPLRSRPDIEKLRGKIPAIKQMHKMSETDYRNFLTIQNMPNIADATKRNMILDLLWGDVKRASNSPLKSIDIMVLQGMSTGKIKIDKTTNPTGVSLGTIDLLMPATGYKKATAKWSVTGSADPVGDIQTIVRNAKAKGISYEKMLMRIETFWKMQKADKFKENISAFYNPGTGATVAVTMERVNEFLVANQLPYIEFVDEVIGLEKDGIIENYQPWELNNITFVPSGKFGVIHNAIAMEEMEPVQAVEYAKAGSVLVSKWKQNNPWGEYTQGELNAFPGIEVIDSMAILQTENT